MSNKVWFKVLISILLLAALIGAGLWVFNMGVMQGATVDGELPAFTERFMAHRSELSAYGPGMHGYYPAYGMGMHTFFSPFRFVGAIIFLFLIIGGFRMLFFGFRGYGHMHHHGCGRRHGYDREGVPPMVEEWHRKMHEQESAPAEEK